LDFREFRSSRLGGPRVLLLLLLPLVVVGADADESIPVVEICGGLLILMLFLLFLMWFIVFFLGDDEAEDLGVDEDLGDDEDGEDADRGVDIGQLC
jgi:hypothetical protein